MKLKQLIILYTPFQTQEDIDDFFVSLIRRNSAMTEELKEKLLIPVMKDLGYTCRIR